MTDEQFSLGQNLATAAIDDLKFKLVTSENVVNDKFITDCFKLLLGIAMIQQTTIYDLRGELHVRSEVAN